MDLAPLDQREVAKRVAHRAAQRLGPVNDEQAGDIRFKPARDQVGQQRLDHGGVLRRTQAAEVRASVEQEKRWVTVAFTWNGLRALGVDEASLATFPEEFRQGMVARAEILGDTGANRPENWVDNMASPDLHAIVILFARDAAVRARCQSEHEKLVRRCEG